ncbi:MAG: GlcG/HbpS family heme-binding protein [Pseudomonadota bacterium]
MPITASALKLTYEGAAKILAAAAAKAEQMQAPQCIAVTDAGGSLLAFGRTDGAAFIASEPAVRKAATAASRGEPSGRLPKEYEMNVGFATDGRFPNLAGGLPIVIDGHVVGGIGVSSGSAEQDLDVARAGLAAIGAKPY